MINSFIKQDSNQTGIVNGKKKLRLVIIAYDSLYANPIFLPLFNEPFTEISAIFISDCILHNRSKLSSLLFLYKKHGFRYFIFKSLDQIIYKLTNLKIYNKQTRFLRKAKKRNIPIINVKDINSFEVISKIKRFEPDLLISYSNQILKKEVLGLPKLGSLNIHPGYLPLYRGVASSFWAMLNENEFGGVTIHYMAEKLDCGDIVNRGKVLIAKNKSLHKHNFLCCKLGGELLLGSLKDIQAGEVKRIKQEKGNYYSWPEQKDVKKYLTKGFKLFSLKDLKFYFK